MSFWNPRWFLHGIVENVFALRNTLSQPPQSLMSQIKNIFRERTSAFPGQSCGEIYSFHPCLLTNLKLIVGNKNKPRGNSAFTLHSVSQGFLVQMLITTELHMVWTSSHKLRLTRCSWELAVKAVSQADPDVCNQVQMKVRLSCDVNTRWLYFCHGEYSICSWWWYQVFLSLGNVD